MLKYEGNWRNPTFLVALYILIDTVNKGGFLVTAKGIIRNLDQLGRIVIPIETRRALGIEPGTPVEIRQEGDKIILIRSGERCAICGSEKALRDFKGKKLCGHCLKELKEELF